MSWDSLMSGSLIMQCKHRSANIGNAIARAARRIRQFPLRVASVLRKVEAVTPPYFYGLMLAMFALEGAGPNQEGIHERET